MPEPETVTAKQVEHDSEGNIVRIVETRRSSDGYLTRLVKDIGTNANGDITSISVVESAKFLDPEKLDRQRDLALARDAASSAHRRGSGAMKLTRDAQGKYRTPARRS